MTDAIGVDVGGTAIKAVVVSDSGTVLRECSVPTPKPDPEGRLTADVIAGCVASLAPAERTSVGITSTGLVNEAVGVVLDSDNLG